MNSLVFASLTAPDDGGVVEASDSPMDMAAGSRRYSFSLKRSLALETKDNTSRKKGVSCTYTSCQDNIVLTGESA
jgi:hypothetical protein